MIRKVSIPMVVGMIVAAVVGPSYILAEVSLALSSLTLAFLFLSRSRSSLLFCLMFFFAGLFCRASCASAPSPVWENPFHTEWLERMVEKVPFGHRETSALIKALLTGDRADIGSETVKAFRASGASHILALSGLHLGMIYLLVTRVLSVSGNSRAAFVARYVLTVSLSGTYALMTGAGPSIMRAFLFILINETAKLYPHRKTASLSTFWSAMTVQLALNPMILDSAGFQLSYLAILGIFLVYPRLRGWYPDSSRADIMKRIWETAALSISCQIFTAPLAYHLFGTFPKYFLLANLIALPLTEILIIGGLASVLLTQIDLCPGLLVRAVDTVARGLEESLRIIAGM